MKFQAPKGVSEYVPPRSNAFAWVRSTLEGAISSAGYQLLELPIFEDTELFTRIGAQQMWFLKRCTPLKIVVVAP